MMLLLATQDPQLILPVAVIAFVPKKKLVHSVCTLYVPWILALQRPLLRLLHVVQSISNCDTKTFSAVTAPRSGLRGIGGGIIVRDNSHGTIV